MEKTRIPVSIDIGFGDKIYPGRILSTFPTLLGMEPPKIYAYSIYSVIAEKFEAFVSLGLANGRYKDFYDIFVLSNSYCLLGQNLKEAIIETFLQRGTKLDDIVAFEDDFVEEPIRQKRWDSFINKKKAMANITFKQAISRCKELLMPIVESITKGGSFQKVWDKNKGHWE